MECVTASQNLERIEVSARVLGLVSRAQNGDKDAFALLYREYVTSVYRYIYFRVGQAEQAEDLTQEVFLKTLNNISGYRYSGKPFVSWLFRIAHNLVIDYYRHTNKKRFIPLAEPLIIIADDGPADTAEQSIEMSAVKQAIDKLPSGQKEVISLRFGAELSIAETAVVIGKTGGTVKKLQHEAIVKLRKLMEI
jgi:RNA polymerase sigma-70 factor (ECF subfamily)